MADVYLHAYNLLDFCGVARRLTLPDGCEIWHTAICVYNKEFGFGPLGIGYEVLEKKKEKPIRSHYLGKTNLDLHLLMEYLLFLNETKFSKEKYNIFSHNCHTFSNFLSNEIVGVGIPKEYINLPGIITVKCGKLLTLMLTLMLTSTKLLSWKALKGIKYHI